MVGDEVITCDLTPTTDRYGNHVCDDRCREIRVVRLYDTLPCILSDLLQGRTFEVYSCDLAPLPLLRRKAEHFRRIEKTVRLWENFDDGSAHVLLDRLLTLINDYSFCGADQLTKLGPMEDPPADVLARKAFDIVAPLIVEHRLTDDRSGAGRRRHLIMGDILNALAIYRADISTLSPSTEIKVF